MNSRNIRSFEADEDVGKNLDKAAAEGFKLVFIYNTALREWFKKKGYNKKPAVREKATA